MEKTNERKILEDMKRYIQMQLEHEPFSEWGKGARDGFEYCMAFFNYLCELHGVKLDEDDH